jgi:hypothetical protein
MSAAVYYVSGFFICCVIFMTPNIVVQIVTMKFSTRFPARWRVFAESLCTNALWSMAILPPLRAGIESYSLLDVGLTIGTLIALGSWLALMANELITAMCSGGDRLAVLKALTVPPGAPENGFGRLAENCSVPPAIRVKGWAGHQESHQEANFWERYDIVTVTHAKEVTSSGYTYHRTYRDYDEVDRPVRTLKSPTRRVDQGGGRLDPPPRLGKNEYFCGGGIQTHYQIVNTWQETRV